ncbi:hypothetical protein K3495_g11534 [Podosphaera aphanis]|nr:hypothetical protein K3495_g11534 [Podosphaera aphanis]
MNSDAQQRAALRRHLGLDNSASDMNEMEKLTLKPNYYFYSRQRHGPQPITISTGTSRSYAPSGVSFFIERSPPTTQPKICSLKSCSCPFQSGHYRVAITPAMSGLASENADLFHVSCLEKIADLSKPAYFSCIEPFTRLTGGTQADGDYLCAGAVERLVLEWKARRIWKTMMYTDGTCNNLHVCDEKHDDDVPNIEEDDDDESCDDSCDNDSSMDDSEDDDDEGSDDDDEEEYVSDNDDVDDDDDEINEASKNKRALNLPPLPNNQNLISPLFLDLWHNAGSSRFNSRGHIPGMQQHEYFNLLTLLAPWESEGPGDNNEWNIFDALLGKKDNQEKADRKNKSNELSAILSKWERWVELVHSPENSLTPQQMDEKKSIGEKGCRAIKRLAVIPMPQTLWQF